MKSSSLLLIFLGIFYCVLSQETSSNVCIANYKCCGFATVNEVVTCIQKCEPEVPCDQNEAIEEAIKPGISIITYSSLSKVCVKGFKLDPADGKIVCGWD